MKICDQDHCAVKNQRSNFATPDEIPGTTQKKNSPLDILQCCFASGQITAKEYVKMKKFLKTILIDLSMPAGED